MIIASYTVICTGCGLVGPSSDVSPGRARDAAKHDGWALRPGKTEPIDLCGPCANTTEESR